MQGTSDLHQLDLIYGLCGTPVAPEAIPAHTNIPNDINKSLLNGDVYNIYKALPGWKNNPIQTQHAPNLANRFSKFDPASLSLLSNMLNMHPKQRISAKDSLKHSYFTGPGVVISNIDE